jgi:CheY-like chemotaxis protein
MITNAAPAPPETQGQAPFSILIVEDDAHIARLLSVNIQKARMQPWHSPTGHGGLHLLEKHQPDLVLLDLMLPDLNGYEVCARMRQKSTVPIVMLTARTSPEDQLRGLKCGADDFVTKPFDITLLMARVASHLRRSLRYNPHAASAITAPAEASAPSAASPKKWSTCRLCGYMGPSEKFEELDDRFQLKSTCPHCLAPQQMADLAGASLQVL